MSRGIYMTTADFKSEHKKLLKTLKHPTQAGLAAEVREQSAEVKKRLKAKADEKAHAYDWREH